MQKITALFNQIAISPLAGKSITICKQYVAGIKDEEIQKPFFMIYPNKHQSALICALGLLEDFYKEDFENGKQFGIKDSLLKRGQRLDFFGGVCEVGRKVGDEIVVKFSDGDMYACEACLQFAKPANGKPLSKLKRYFNGKANARKKRTFAFLSKETEFINTAWLSSKVLFIAGRGNVLSTKAFINDNKIENGEKIEKLLPNENLLIKADLEEYKSFLELDLEGKSRGFKLKLKRRLEGLATDDFLQKSIKNITKLLDENAFRNTGFLILFEELCDQIEDQDVRSNLEELLEREFPGLEQEFPEDLKMLIINDLHQFVDYPKVIELFCKKKIPVLVIDDLVSPGFDFDYGSFFRKRPSLRRLYWSKQKILNLATENGTDAYVDQLFWERSLRHSQQKIHLVKVEDQRFDKAFNVFEVSKILLGEERLERLKSAYYERLRPAIYALKNAPAFSVLPEVKNRIQEFRALLSRFSRSFSTADFDKLQEALGILEAGNFNQKELPKKGETLYLQAIQKKQLINFSQLQGIKTTKRIDTKIKEIVFSGYPYNEYINKILLESIFINQTKSIKINCYGSELKLTSAYLENRYYKKQFEELIPSKIASQFQKSVAAASPFIYAVYHEEIPKEEAEEILSIQETIKDFRYQEYLGKYGGNEEEGDHLVACDLLHFQSGNFMFLPKESSIDCLRYEGNQWRLRRRKFRAITRDDLVVRYDLNREEIIRLAKNADHIEHTWKILDAWRKYLDALYQKQGNSIQKLSEFMKKTMPNLGNPSAQNLIRWRGDDLLLSPDPKHLELIFGSSGLEKTTIVNYVDQIMKAKKKILQLNNNIRNALKEQLIKTLEEGRAKENFSLVIQGVSIKTQIEQITGKERKQDTKIKYLYTRKIIESC